MENIIFMVVMSHNRNLSRYKDFDCKSHHPNVAFVLDTMESYGNLYILHEQILVSKVSYHVHKSAHKPR